MKIKRISSIFILYALCLFSLGCSGGSEEEMPQCDSKTIIDLGFISLSKQVFNIMGTSKNS